MNEEGFLRLNTNADAVIDVSRPSDENSQVQILESLRRNPQLVLMAVRPIEGDASFFHNVQELSGGIGSSFVSLVGLQSWGGEATTVQLEHRLFLHRSTVDCPSEADLWNTTSSSNFKGIAAISGRNKRKVAFGKVMAIPPFLLKAFLDAGSSAPEDLGFLAAATGKAFLEENNDAPNIENLKDRLGNVLSFL